MPRYFAKFPKLAYTTKGTTSLVTNLLARVDVIRKTLDNISLFYQYDIQEGDTPEIIASKYYDDPELHWLVLLFNLAIDPHYDWPMTYSQFKRFIESNYGSIPDAQATIHHYERIVTKTDNSSGTISSQVFELPLTVLARIPLKFPELQSFPVVANTASLPSSNNITNDGYQTEDTQELYVWDGFDWNLQPSFKKFNEIVEDTDTLTFSTGSTVTIQTSKQIIDCYTYEDVLNESKRRIQLVKSELAPEIVKQFEGLMEQ